MTGFTRTVAVCASVTCALAVVAVYAQGKSFAVAYAEEDAMTEVRDTSIEADARAERVRALIERVRKEAKEKRESKKDRDKDRDKEGRRRGERDERTDRRGADERGSDEGDEEPVDTGAKRETDDDRHGDSVRRERERGDRDGDDGDDDDGFVINIDTLSDAFVGAVPPNAAAERVLRVVADDGRHDDGRGDGDDAPDSSPERDDDESARERTYRSLTPVVVRKEDSSDADDSDDTEREVLEKLKRARESLRHIGEKSDRLEKRVRERIAEDAEHALRALERRLRVGERTRDDDDDDDDDESDASVYDRDETEEEMRERKHRRTDDREERRERAEVREHALVGKNAEDEKRRVRGFEREEREEMLARLRERIERQQDKLEDELESVLAPTVARRVPPTDIVSAVDAVLQSSIEELELLIREEAGVEVDLSRTKREVRAAAAQEALEIARRARSLRERDGLALYRDSDGDGVSDYDEVHLYDTDPYNAYTAGSVLTDGERILLGLNVHSTGVERVPVESPKESGEVAPELFTVTRIEAVEVPASVSVVLDEGAVSDSDSAARTDERDAPIEPAPSSADNDASTRAIVFAGTALPNSFVTLYIFSTPIVVTVKTDAAGDWTYTLTEELEDGRHEVYVASVSNAGNIIAKSDPIPFIKTAEAVEFTPPAPAVFADDTVASTRTLFLWIALILAAFTAVTVIATVGFWRTRRPRVSV